MNDDRVAQAIALLDALTELDAATGDTWFADAMQRLAGVFADAGLTELADLAHEGVDALHTREDLALTDGSSA